MEMGETRRKNGAAEALFASLGLVLCAGLYISFSIYLHSRLRVSLTTRKSVTGEHGEGSNACSLPCGVGGFG